MSAAIFRSRVKSDLRRWRCASAVAAPSRMASVTMACSHEVASTGDTTAPALGLNWTQPCASSRRRASRTGIGLTPSSRARASMLSLAIGAYTPV